MNKPLAGRRIVITREEKQALEFGNQLLLAGGDPVYCPVLSVIPSNDLEETNQHLSQLEKYQWIVFTSPNAVEYFFKLYHDQQTKTIPCKIAAVGKKTESVIKANGFPVDLVPKAYHAKSLIQSFSDMGIQGFDILFPCSNRARKEIENGLSDLGARVHRFEIYSVVPNTALSIKQCKSSFDEKIDCITFFSPSALQAFVQLFGENFVESDICNKIPIAVMGPTTAEKVKKICPEAEVLIPVKSTLSGLVEALERYFND